MATSFQLEHSFEDIPLAKFEEYLNHPRLTELLGDMPAFRSREMVEEKKAKNGEIRWKFKVVAGGDIPGPVQKILSPEMFTWWEISRFVPEEHCIYWEIEPIVAKDKFQGSGVWQLQKLGKGCKRIIEGEISVKIPFVGRVAEAFLVNELKKNYEVEPDIQRRFYKEMRK